MSDLTHIGGDGKARMVDIGEKPVTARTATASGFIRMAPATVTAVSDNAIAKGDVLGIARVAGIMAAKRTAGLIPLCHDVGLSLVDVSFDVSSDGIAVAATASVHGRTGVEMEALVAATGALLTIYDMTKAIDRTMEIGAVRLEEKTGGRSGDWTR